MSRIGKLPVAVPSGVKVAVAGQVINIEGAKGKMSYTTRPSVRVIFADGQLVVSMVGKDSQANADFGTTRSHLNNMVKGVSAGWKKSLELTGVGFGAKITGKKIVLSVDYTHDVEVDIPDVVKCAIAKNVIDIESCDKEALGTFAAKVRDVFPSEPYLGKGIKYSDEVVRRKAGKTGKK